MDAFKFYQGYVGNKNWFFAPSFGKKTIVKEKSRKKNSVNLGLASRLMENVGREKEVAKDEGRNRPLVRYFRNTSAVQEKSKLGKFGRKREISCYRSSKYRRSCDAGIQNVSTDSLFFPEIQTMR